MKVTAAKPQKGALMPAESPLSALIRVLLILVFDVAAIWFIVQAFGKGFDQLAVVLGIVVVLMNVIFLLPKAYPWRWMALGLAFWILFVIYPIIFTIYVAFTNYGDGHLLTKEQALPIIEKATYMPENATSFTWTAFVNPEKEYALWLVDKEGKVVGVNFATSSRLQYLAIARTEANTVLNDLKSRISTRRPGKRLHACIVPPSIRSAKRINLPIMVGNHCVFRLFHR